jgi:hypothetical protein
MGDLPFTSLCVLWKFFCDELSNWLVNRVVMPTRPKLVSGN